jgi:hypothetical protein
MWLHHLHLGPFVHQAGLPHRSRTYISQSRSLCHCLYRSWDLSLWLCGSAEKTGIIVDGTHGCLQLSRLHRLCLSREFVITLFSFFFLLLLFFLLSPHDSES